MSLMSSPFLAKLQELKLWQGNYDALLKHNRSWDVTNPSDFESIDGLSALDVSRSSFREELDTPERKTPVDWDQKPISPPKPFEQLLEEKLAEDHPVEVQTKPKRPFLKKRAGLARYNLPPKSTDNKPIITKKSAAKQCHPTTTVAFSQNKDSGHSKEALEPALASTYSQNYNVNLNKKKVDAVTEPEFSMIPLKMPDVIIRPKATWVKIDEASGAHKANSDVKKDKLNQEVGVGQVVPTTKTVRHDINISPIIQEERSFEHKVCKNGDNDRPSSSPLRNTVKRGGTCDDKDRPSTTSHGERRKSKKIYGEIDKFLIKHEMRASVQKTNASNTINTSPTRHEGLCILDKLNEYALKRLLDSPKRSSTSPLPHSHLTPRKSCSARINHSRKSILESTTDHELHIFEALEQKVNNSSFSSTNSSIARLLSSTPSRKETNKERKSPILEHESGSPDCNEESENAGRMKKKDFLSEFLTNLRKIATDDDLKKWGCAPKMNDNNKATPNTSFTESTNTGSSRAESPSSFYTDFENTLQGVDVKKADAAINTSGTEAEKITEVKICQKCEMLENLLEKSKLQISEVQREKLTLCGFVTDLEKKNNQLERDLKKLQQRYDADIEELRKELKELEDQKKKAEKEKAALLDVYKKESQNKNLSKKEKEEISFLKREVTELKELQKLKEARNGASQARLRNQVKQLEKDKLELIDSMEKLQKENAKLLASQKLRRPTSEVKMLHEINKNITKLTEETFKKHLTTSSDSQIDSTGKKTSDSDNEPILSKMKVRSDRPQKKSVQEDHGSKENDSDITKFVDLSLEKQYENVFGTQSSPGVLQNTLNDSKKDKGKTETVFPDGSKEIKYSNGNTKSISPDGNLIIVQYYNGDVKETNLVNHTLRYYYAENCTWHTQFDDGSELLEYPSGQKEKKFKNGTIEIQCPDGNTVTKHPDGTEEVVYPDSFQIIKHVNGEKILLFPNGQKEIHTKEHKRREYPDGTVKMLYPDGTQETRYASGRVRIKDSEGNLLLDTRI